MSFTWNTRVYFDQADLASIQFFAQVYTQAHRCLEHFIENQGIEWSQWFQHPVHGVPLVHTEADYQAPLLPGKELQIKLSVLRLGESSVKFQFDFSQSNQVAAQVRTTHVFIDRNSHKKTKIPEDLRQMLTPFLAPQPD